MAEAINLAVSLLGQLARELEGMSDTDLQLIKDGNAKIRVSVSGKAKKNSKNDDSEIPDAEMDTLLEKLNSTETREAGVELLRSYTPHKAGLFRLSRRLDLPVTKVDSVDRIIDRIVESTIGYRLRSRAVQNQAI